MSLEAAELQPIVQAKIFTLRLFQNIPVVHQSCKPCT